MSSSVRVRGLGITSNACPNVRLAEWHDEIFCGSKERECEGAMIVVDVSAWVALAYSDVFLAWGIRARFDS